MLKRIFNADAIFAGIMLAVSIGFYVMSLGFRARTVDGGVNEGYVPQMLAVIVGLMALSIIVDSIIKDRHYFIIQEKQRETIKTLLLMIALFSAYILVWKYVHFILQTFLLLIGMCYVLKMSKKFTFVFSAVSSVGLYFLFSSVFNILL